MDGCFLVEYLYLLLSCCAACKFCKFLSWSSVSHSWFMSHRLSSGKCGGHGHRNTCHREARKPQFLIGSYRGFQGHFWPLDIFLSVSFVIGFIVTDLVGLNVCSKRERHGQSWPCSPVSQQCLLRRGPVSLLPRLLGGHIFWKQEWRALGFTNDSRGDTSGGLLSWGGHCENAPVCILQEMKDDFLSEPLKVAVPRFLGYPYKKMSRI